MNLAGIFHRQPPAYVLHRYLDRHSHFDYDGYVRTQTEANHRKLATVWAREEDIRFLADHLLTRGQPSFGLCHGTRGGQEQSWFSRYLGCAVMGTEIADTAVEFPQTVRWDFHETRPEWLGTCDFVYSNALDHAYDPGKALRAWVSCLKPEGVCIIEHSSYHTATHADSTDPFGADLALMPYLVLDWGKGTCSVRRIIEHDGRHFLIIERNP